jgi:hypothetical protein
VLTIKVRKDQINDLLKSLTVVDRRNGQAVSVSMPLDPQAWANAALATLAPGQGSLDQIIDALRGNEVVLGTTQGKLRGRIVMIEAIEDEPDASPPAHSERVMPPQAGSKDFRLTVLEGKKMQVVRLSKVRSITLRDGNLALQFHRSLDATAGEGMFQQVAVDIRLAGDNKHELSVSYVVEAPMWKPTYRVVLPEAGKGKALLQGWAVVDNTSGEDWSKVTMSLTSGAPIAFRYDLHTPRIVPRSDLSGSGNYKRAAVAMGETSYGPAGADRDGDGIADSGDSCPDTPETYNGVTDTRRLPRRGAEHGRGAPVAHLQLGARGGRGQRRLQGGGGEPLRGQQGEEEGHGDAAPVAGQAHHAHEPVRAVGRGGRAGAGRARRRPRRRRPRSTSSRCGAAPRPTRGPRRSAG